MLQATALADARAAAEGRAQVAQHRPEYWRRQVAAVFRTLFLFLSVGELHCIAGIASQSFEGPRVRCNHTQACCMQTLENSV